MSQPPDGAELQARARRRMVLWTLLGVWGIVAYVLGGRLSVDMRFRVNDLSTIPGAGLVQRDADGVFYHVRPDGKARAIFPSLETPGYTQECLDCTLVTGEQMSQTNDFCISGKRSELPKLAFEIPCHTWGPIGEGQKVMGFVLFIVPIAMLLLIRSVLRKLQKRQG